MREIMLSKGRAVSLVDDEDYERVMAYGPWQLTGANHGTSDGASYRYGSRRVKGRTVMLHRFIIDAPTGMVVDHVNHDGLDNRKCNLRLCTHAQNLGNRRKKPGLSSQYLGVYWHKPRGQWAAMCDRKHLGLFRSESDAARAYDAAAKVMHGEFANLNFPQQAA